MRISVRLTFWLYVMDAASFAYRNGARGAAYGRGWAVPVWLAVMDGAYDLYVWALRKASDSRWR